MTRVLTKFFPSRGVSKFIKKHDKNSVFDVIDLLMSFDIDILAEFIATGNPNMTLDQAYDALDNYIQADESRSFMSTAMTLLVEFDMDKHALSSLGIPASKIKERMDTAIEGLADKFNGSLNDMADNAIGYAQAAAGVDNDEPHIEVESVDASNDLGASFGPDAKVDMF